MDILSLSDEMVTQMIRDWKRNPISNILMSYFDEQQSYILAQKNNEIVASDRVNAALQLSFNSGQLKVYSEIKNLESIVFDELNSQRESKDVK